MNSNTIDTHDTFCYSFLHENSWKKRFCYINSPKNKSSHRQSTTLSEYWFTVEPYIHPLYVHSAQNTAGVSGAYKKRHLIILWIYISNKYLRDVKLYRQLWKHHRSLWIILLRVIKRRCHEAIPPRHVCCISSVCVWHSWSHGRWRFKRPRFWWHSETMYQIHNLHSSHMPVGSIWVSQIWGEVGDWGSNGDSGMW